MLFNSGQASLIFFNSRKQSVRKLRTVKGGTKGGHWGGVKVDLLRERLRLGKAAVSGAGTQSGDACEGGP